MERERYLKTEDKITENFQERLMSSQIEVVFCVSSRTNKHKNIVKNIAIELEDTESKRKFCSRLGDFEEPVLPYGSGSRICNWKPKVKVARNSFCTGISYSHTISSILSLFKK